MAVNKVVYDGKTLIDLTSDTVTPDNLLNGQTAHDKSGAPIVGTCTYDMKSSDVMPRITALETSVNNLNNHPTNMDVIPQYHKGVAISDWNDVIYSGVYRQYNAANSPTADWWIVEVFHHNEAYVIQVAHHLFNPGVKYSRTLTDGTWNPWVYIGYVTNDPNMIPNLQNQINNILNKATVKDYCDQWYSGTDISDWNHVMTNGLYMKGNALNPPEPDAPSWWLVEVLAHNELHVVQTAHNLFDASKKYSRTCNDRVWKPWVRLGGGGSNVEIVDTSQVSFVEGYAASGPGSMVKMGHLVHCAFHYTVTSGSHRTGPICNLPFTPSFARYFSAQGIDYNTQTSGVLNCETPLSPGGSVFCEFTYTCV